MSLLNILIALLFCFEFELFCFELSSGQTGRRPPARATFSLPTSSSSSSSSLLSSSSSEKHNWSLHFHSVPKKQLIKAPAIGLFCFAHFSLSNSDTLDKIQDYYVFSHLVFTLSPKLSRLAILVSDIYAVVQQNLLSPLCTHSSPFKIDQTQAFNSIEY